MNFIELTLKNLTSLSKSKIILININNAIEIIPLDSGCRICFDSEYHTDVAESLDLVKQKINNLNKEK